MTLAGTEPPIGSGLFSFRNEPRLYLTPDKQAGSAQSISLLCLWGMMLCAGAMALPSAAFAQSSADQDTRLRLEQQMEGQRSEEHTSELQSLMRISYAVFCLKKKKQNDENVGSKRDYRQE